LPLFLSLLFPCPFLFPCVFRKIIFSLRSAMSSPLAQSRSRRWCPSRLVASVLSRFFPSSLNSPSLFPVLRSIPTVRGTGVLALEVFRKLCDLMQSAGILHAQMYPLQICHPDVSTFLVFRNVDDTTNWRWLCTYCLNTKRLHFWQSELLLTKGGLVNLLSHL